MEGVVVKVLGKILQHLFGLHCQSGHAISAGFGNATVPAGQAKRAHVLGKVVGVEVTVETTYGVVVRVAAGGMQHLRASRELH